MSLSNDELQLLQGLAGQVEGLRTELAAWQQRALSLEKSNAQLSQQINALNASNKALSEWQTQVTKVVNDLSSSRNVYDKQLTDLCKQLTERLSSL